MFAKGGTESDDESVSLLSEQELHQPAADTRSGSGSSGRTWNDRIGSLDTHGAPASLPHRRSVRGERLYYKDGDDFTTLDWSVSHSVKPEPQRPSSPRTRGWCGWLWRKADEIQGWILTALVGVLTAFLATGIHMGAEWMADLKLGFCNNSLWLSREICCAGSYFVDYSKSECKVIGPGGIRADPDSGWQCWSDMFGVPCSNEGLSWFLQMLFYVLIATLFASVSAWLVLTFAKYAAGSGISEVKTILGGFVIKQFLSGWTLLIKVVGLVLSVASGLSLGKEGPCVHVACCVGNLLSRIFPKYHHNELRKRELLSASAAAGVSVAFGAPLGGVLFSLEEVSSYFPHKTMWRTFFCAIIAAMVLRAMDPTNSGKLTLFAVEYKHEWRYWELILFLILGVMGGLIGTAFIKLNVRLAALRKRTRLQFHPILEVMAVTFVTALINFQFQLLREDSLRLLRALFKECSPNLEADPFNLCSITADGTRYTVETDIMWLLLGSVFIKLLCTVFTFGLKLPAGVFVPSLVIGALMGRLVGSLMIVFETGNQELAMFDSCQNCINPGIYAMVGAAAVLGGVTRMTVSLVVIMFELTGGLTYVVPFMTCVLVSKWVGDVFTASIYDEMIRFNGYPFLDTKSEISLAARACDVMSGDVAFVTLHDNTVGNLHRKVQTCTFKGFPLVSSREDRVLLGYIRRSDLQKALRRARSNPAVNSATPCIFSSLDNSVNVTGTVVDLISVVDRTPAQIVEDTSLDRVFEMFKQLGIRYCLVVHHGILKGIITKKDFLEHMELYHPAFSDKYKVPRPRGAEADSVNESSPRSDVPASESSMNRSVNGGRSDGLV